jgi:branched-chain amino acid transport system permease protein
MAGTSGSVYALNMLFVNPTLFAVNWTAVPVLIAIVGGTATILGPILMALVYVFLLLSVFSSFPTLNQVVYGLLLIAISLVLPRGLTNLLKRTGKSVRLAQPHFPR